MARSYGNLWPDVVSWSNLLLAYRRCRRRKRFKSVATRFDFASPEQLLRLRQELSEGTYAPGEYRHFYIREPKRRKISAAPFRDRVVHHALINVLEPIFERSFIADSYACRRGKGTHRAVDRAQQYMRRYPYLLKTDIVRFLPNIDRETRRINQSALARFNRRLRRLRWQFARGDITAEQIQTSLKAWLAYADNANSAGIRREIWRRVRFRRRSDAR